MRYADAVFAALTVCLGIWIVWSGLDYGFTVRDNPGPGFFPVWVGAGIAILGTVNVARSVAGYETLGEAFDRPGLLKSLAAALCVAVYVMLVSWFGMILASMPLMFVLGLIIEPKREREFILRLAIISVLVPLGAWLLFGVYLGVRLEAGIFGI